MVSLESRVANPTWPVVVKLNRSLAVLSRSRPTGSCVPLPIGNIKFKAALVRVPTRFVYYSRLVSSDFKSLLDTNRKQI